MHALVHIQDVFQQQLATRGSGAAKDRYLERVYGNTIPMARPVSAPTRTTTSPVQKTRLNVGGGGDSSQQQRRRGQKSPSPKRGIQAAVRNGEAMRSCMLVV